jgi:hypothetical protein
VTRYEANCGYLTPAATVHIHHYADTGQPRHDMAADCWCGPDVTRCAATLVIDHHGAAQPSVRAHLITPQMVDGIGRRRWDLAPCGTQAAYRRHQRHGETPCEACHAAKKRHRTPERQAAS